MSSPIGWTDQTWNPVTGCTPISEGCAHCYARRMAQRLKGRFGYPADEPFRVTLHPDRLGEPLRWHKPRHVFVCSMGDLFHEDVPDEFIARVFGVLAITCPDAWLIVGDRPVPIGPHHVFQVLTKRPERMHRLLTDPAFPELVGSVSGVQPLLPMPHVWLGVTAENQQRALERIPTLLATPAAVRFVSVEPMLGPVDLWGARYRVGDGYQGAVSNWPGSLDWVICGPENGPDRRPFDIQWARDLRDQCVGAGVPFWYKGGLLDGEECHQRPEVTP